MIEPLLHVVINAIDLGGVDHRADLSLVVPLGLPKLDKVAAHPPPDQLGHYEHRRDRQERTRRFGRRPGAVKGERALAFYRARPPAEPARTLLSIAAVLIMPELIGRRMCRDLIELWQTQGHDEGKVGSVVDAAEVDRVYHDMKKGLDHKIMDPEFNRRVRSCRSRRCS